MPKKAKVGKQRRDKAYWSAKEIGYRSRASFKLIQLNRKFEFLQKSRVCLDLCAAPGSWMQVAKEHMPLSSLIVGVDLVPIKPIAGCISSVNDITTEKCRTDLKKELQGWKADLVLHDGAPNVGKSWVHDAYQQSLLTLSAFKLATEFLQKNGTFVTKIFRSKDYSAIIWVLNQFFKRVHATKPAASRNESAEIFVVCQGYKAPDKIDPKFLDPKHVFFEVETATKNENELVNPEKKKRAPAEGYENQTLLFKQEKASEFIMGNNPIHILNNCHEIFIDQARIKKHKKTTQEITECCKDIKVLGMKELRALKKWREALRTDFEKEEKEGKVPETAEPVEEETGEGAEDNSDLEDIQKLEDEISELKEEERKTAKRLKKKKLKEKRKTAERINLKMIIPGDIGPVHEEEGLFRMKDLDSVDALNKVAEDQNPEIVAESDEDEDSKPREPKVEKFSRDKGRLDKSGIYYHESDSEEAASSDDESSDDDILEEKDEDSDADLGPEFEAPPSPTNPLIVELEDGVSRKERRAQVWFDKDIFAGIDDDECLEDADVEAAITAIKKKGGKIMEKKPEPKIGVAKANGDAESGYTSDDSESEPKKAKKSKKADGDDSDSSDSDSDYDMNQMQSLRTTKKEIGKTVPENGFEVVPIKKKKLPVLTADELALGQTLVTSRKRKRDIMDMAWNRYMFNDVDQDLPDWFVKEEEYHMRKRPDVDPELVAYYKERARDMNTKTIKKVVEAKARKKRREVKRMDKARKKAATIIDNEDLGNREKVSEIKKLYKKAAAGPGGKKPEIKYVVAKKANASQRARRPAGHKGPYKQVDPRMKKDTNLKRGNATSKKNQKRRLKGRKTKSN